MRLKPMVSCPLVPSSAHGRAPMRAAHQLLQSVEFSLLRREHRALLSRLLFLTLDLLLLTLELFLLLFDLCLLFFEGVDEDGRELIVFDAFDLAFRVAKGKQRSTFSTSSAPRPMSFAPSCFHLNEIGRRRLMMSRPPMNVATLLL